MLTAVSIFLHALALLFAISSGVSFGKWDKTKVRAEARAGTVQMALSALIQAAALMVMP